MQAQRFNHCSTKMGRGIGAKWNW